MVRSFDAIQCGGLYGSRMVAAGDLVFFGGTAFGPAGGLAPEAVPPAPYGNSPSAQVRYQTQHLFTRLREGFAAMGGSLDDIVQIEQYVMRKRVAHGYTRVARGPEFLSDPDRRPSSFMVRGGTTLPIDALVTVTGFAGHPAAQWEKEQVPLSEEELGFRAPPGFGHVVRSGPFVLTTVWPSDYVHGIHPDLRVSQWTWRESEIENEAQWVINQLRLKLQAAGSSISDIAHCTLLLTDPADLHEFDLLWKEALGADAPARSVVLIPEFGAPRWEGATGHLDGTTKMELQVRAVRPGMGYDKDVPASSGEACGWAASCVRTGSVLWCSTLPPSNPGASIADQVRSILGRLSGLCVDGGTSIENLYRIRVHASTVDALIQTGGVLAEALPGDPPVVHYLQAPVETLYPGAAVMMDAVAYVPA